MKRLLTTWLGMVAVLGLMLGTGPARADTFTYFLDASNFSGFTPPYARVDLKQDTGISGFDVTVTALAGDGTNTSGTALIDHFGFNLASPGVLSTAVTNISPSGYQFFQDYSPSGIAYDGFGKFTQTVGVDDHPGGGSSSNRTQTISFDIAGIGTNPNVFLTNSNGNQFAVKWYSSNLEGATTGFAAVPEPGPLLGAGVVTLLGLGYTWRLRRRATA